MNISPTPTTIYKDTTLGTTTPSQLVMLLGIDEDLGQNTSVSSNEFHIDCENMSTTEEHELHRLLNKFSSLFVSVGVFKQATQVKHSIKTTGPPIRQPLCRLTETLKGVVKDEVDKMIREEIIRPSDSPWSSPIVMVRKKDGSWRFCVDYRKLNSVTCRHAFPLSRIDATLDSLAGATYFSILDLTAGYWQVELKKEDIMGPLPTTSRGKKYILITDIFSKWVEAFSLCSTDTETLTSLLLNEVVYCYGVPSTLHSDQGANLTSNVVSSLCKRVEIQCTQTTTYHPQGDGQVEKFNRTLEAMLSKLVNENQKDWDLHIPKVLFAYRTALHKLVDLLFCRMEEEDEKDIPQFVQDATWTLKHIYEDIHQKLKEVHQANNTRYNKQVAGDKLVVGDRVWLFSPAVEQGRTKKLTPLWRGP